MRNNAEREHLDAMLEASKKPAEAKLGPDAMMADIKKQQEEIKRNRMTSISERKIETKGTQPTASELKAIVEKLKMQYAKIQSARKNVSFPGLDDIEKRKLEDELKALKAIALEDNNITVEMYTAADGDSEELAAAKKELQNEVEFIGGV
jgi:hypothetical protein